MVVVDVLLVAIGGVLGGVARVGVSTLVARIFGDRLPWGIFAVNATGAFAIGLVAGLVAADTRPWLFLVTGLLGSYTTVATFSLQTLFLIDQGAIGRAALNVAGSALVCLLAAAAGLWLTRP